MTNETPSRYDGIDPFTNGEESLIEEVPAKSNKMKIYDQYFSAPLHETPSARPSMRKTPTRWHSPSKVALLLSATRRSVDRARRRTRALLYPLLSLSYTSWIAIHLVLFAAIGGYSMGYTTESARSLAIESVTQSVQQIRNISNMWIGSLPPISISRPPYSVEDADIPLIEKDLPSDQKMDDEVLSQWKVMTEGRDADMDNLREQLTTGENRFKEEILQLRAEVDDQRRRMARLETERAEIEKSSNEMSKEVMALRAKLEKDESAGCTEENGCAEMSFSSNAKTRNVAIAHKGAVVIEDKTSPSVDRTRVDAAHHVITDSWVLISGRCFPVSTPGNISIRFSQPSTISHVEYRHLFWSEGDGPPPSAPQLLAMQLCHDENARVCDEAGSCQLDEESVLDGRKHPSAQATGLPLRCPIRDELRSNIYRSMTMRVLSNYGGSYSCLYRMRVMGLL